MLHQKEEGSPVHTGLDPGFEDVTWTNLVSRTVFLLSQHNHPYQQLNKGMLIQQVIDQERKSSYTSPQHIHVNGYSGREP